MQLKVLITSLVYPYKYYGITRCLIHPTPYLQQRIRTFKGESEKESSILQLNKYEEPDTRTSYWKIPISSAAYPAERSQGGILSLTANQYYSSPKFRQCKMGSVIDRMKKLGEKVENFAQGIREHVRTGPKLSETVKGKLRLGARILQVGGLKEVFKQNFSVSEGEKLLKASQCYLSTTAGPLAGLLFISSDKVAFCSERSIKLSTPTRELLRIHYKVSVPLRKIMIANERKNVKDPSRKYRDIITRDNFEFWFMGFRS